MDDNTIPEDVAEKILRFARAAQAVATMRGKSYLSMGSVSMGIAGSIVNPDFFQEYLGMRNESVDLTEIIRRMEEGIYDQYFFRLERYPRSVCCSYRERCLQRRGYVVRPLTDQPCSNIL